MHRVVAADAVVGHAFVLARVRVVEAEELSGEGTAKKKKNKKRKKRNKKKDKDPSEMASLTSPKSIVSPLQDKLDEKL